MESNLKNSYFSHRAVKSGLPLRLFVLYSCGLLIGFPLGEMRSEMCVWGGGTRGRTELCICPSEPGGDDQTHGGEVKSARVKEM